MMATWLFYCTLVATLLGIAAVAGEAALRASGRPVRWVWVGAMAGSLALPLAVWLGWPAWGGEAAVVAEPAVLEEVVVEASLPAAPVAGLLDVPLRYAWLGASALLLLVVLASLLRLRRERARWRPAEVGGTPVLVSGRTGPAALGFVRGSIVVPEWALALDERLRALMLLHEAEHLRAGDPRLVVAALAALVAMPWNPALWWQFWRLRQALELDCDARVLRRSPDARAYGELLLEVGRRRGGGGLVMAGLAEPRPFLERRIRLIGRLGAGRRLGRSLASAGVSALLVIGACEAPEPLALPEEAGPHAAVDGYELVLEPVPEGMDPAECRPILFVDGERIGVFGEETEARLNGLGPDDIARIEIRKGASISVDAKRHATLLGGCGEIRITTSAAQGGARAAAEQALTRLRALVSAAERTGADVPAGDSLRIAGATPVPSRALREMRLVRARQAAVELFEAVPGRITGEISASEPDAAGAAQRARRLGEVAGAMRGFQSFTPDMVAPSLENREEVTRVLAESYPRLLRDAGIGGTVPVLFWIDAQGAVTDWRVSSSSGYPELDAAAGKVASMMRFSPARGTDGAPRPVVVAIPIAFQATPLPKP